MKKNIILIFIIYSFCASVLSAEPANKEVVIQNNSSQQQIKLEQMATEVLILKVKLEEMRRSEDRLLATVLWSIGGVFTLAIALAAFSWFTSSRLHQREVKLLQQDLSNELEHKVRSANSEIENIINDRLTNKEQELAESSHKHILKLHAEVVSITKLSEAKIRLRIGDNNESINSALQALSAAKQGNTNYIAHALDVITEVLNSSRATENTVKKETIINVKNALGDYAHSHTDKRAIALGELLRNYL
jgi:C4-dicarboxylate-specific signal transduction histidine kinase